MSDETIKQLHRAGRSNVPAMLGNLAGVAIGALSLATGWPTSHPAWIVLVTLWLAYFQHTWTMIFHEDAHYTLYRARWHNVLNGTIVGTLLLVPFSVYRQVHVRHHSKMNTPEDWELWPYTDPKTSLRFRQVFVWFDLLLGLLAGPYIYGRIYFVRGSPLTDRRLRRRIALEYALAGVFWGGLLAVVAYHHAWALFARVYLVPAWLTGMIQTTRKLTEHLGMPAGDPMRGARTVLWKTPVGRFFSYTSFHIFAHGLHHRYPQMPHDKLEEAYRATKEGRAGGVVFHSYWAAVRDMASHLLRPGIGANAGPAAGALPAPAA